MTEALLDAPAARADSTMDSPAQFSFLLVEDNPADAEILRIRIEEGLGKPFNLRVVPTLAGTLDEIQRQVPDLVFLDLSLPDAYGLDLVRRVVGALPDVPVVVLTGESDEAKALLTAAAGVQDFISKNELESRLLSRLIHFAIYRKRVESDLRREKERADRASRAKSDFLGMISHELRTPMNIIMGFLELIPSADSETDRNEYVSHIRQASQHLLSIINDLLDVRRLEECTLTLENERFQLEDTLTRIRQFVRAPAERKGLAFDMHFEGPTTLALVGDSARLTRVLLNILSNALKFTDYGRIDVFGRATRLPAGLWQLEFIVSDTGCGIPQEKIPLLFEPFCQINPVMTRARDGAGLGLFIASRVCSLMHGSLSVESTVGAGSRFTARVQLPPADTAAQPA